VPAATAPANQPRASGWHKGGLSVCMKKVPLTCDNRACLGSCQPHIEGTFHVKNSARTARVTVSCDGKGMVSQAGVVLLRETLRVTGLGRNLSRCLSRWRAPRAVHDPGKIVADLAAAVAQHGRGPRRGRPAVPGAAAPSPAPQGPGPRRLGRRDA
jgi:hypothetical protein